MSPSWASQLEGADELWSECADRYGTGERGYRVDIAEIFDEHFSEDLTAQDANRKVDRSLSRIWKETVVDPVIAAVTFEEEEP